MTVTREVVDGLSVPWPNRLLTLADWDALADDARYRWAELDEGVLVLAPSANAGHQNVAWNLCARLRATLPATLNALEAMDVELVELPATVCQPDVLIVPQELVEQRRPRFRPAEVLLAVEIVSPGSRSRDAVLKRHRYGAAGIASYWVIDLERDPALTVFSDPQPDGGYASETSYGRDEVVALSLPGTDEPVRFSVADLLRR